MSARISTRQGFYVTIFVCAWLFMVSSAHAVNLYDASLRNGDYGGGSRIDTMDYYHGGSPHVLGIVDSAAGVTFTPTETTGNSNALINFPQGASSAGFRAHGTISLKLNADSAAQLAMTTWGHLFCENYGYNQFNNGQSSFSTYVSRVANGPGVDDDQLSITLRVMHVDTMQWYSAGSIILDFGRWYNVGFTWGGPTHDYEIWVDGQLRSGWDLPAGVNLPWGLNWPPSATNVGLGGQHERGLGTNGNYTSAVGITYADFHMWDEYRAQGDTEPIPEPGAAVILLTASLALQLRPRRR